LPKPPRSTKNLKRKRHAAETDGKSIPKKMPAAATKRPRLDPTVSTVRGRAAKAQANIKLDAQAKELAAFQRDSTAFGASKKEVASTPLPGRPVGTRVSRRLRGDVEDGWQPVPEEWLSEAGNTKEEDKRKVTELKTGLESDQGSISDLTELSSLEETVDVPTPENVDSKTGEMGQVMDDRELDGASTVPDGFIEWETVSAARHR
jgi:hypothetical protein